ncbi:hypothetical protein ALP94_00220 [Pseudomonas savastanoi pv. glycinea]|nr:hypothetical protein ALP94_00220 [Pseudomonas savastanoi pv. glycinea]
MTAHTHKTTVLCLCLLISSCSVVQQLSVTDEQLHPRALDLPPATVTEAPNGELVLQNLGANANVKVTYPVINNGHNVGLRWTGKTTYNAPVQTVGATRPLAFTIPKTTIAQDAGGTGVLTYSVGVGDNPLEISQPRPIKVIGTPAPGGDYPKPAMPAAPNGKLDLATMGATVSVTATYPGITNGHNVGMRWKGKSQYEAPLQTVGAIRPLTFEIPKAEVAKDVGGTAVLTYSVGIGNDPLKISDPLAIEVINALPSDGAAIAAALNARYTDTRASCPGNTPAYYCNGVVIRGTQNGNFDPWNPSAGAIALGGTSFSYMRVDANVTPARNSGLIFTSQEKAIAANKIVEYLCIYVHNASTSGNMRDKGCGMRPRSNIAADLSSCASINVRTLAQWSAHAATLPNAAYQCSLSTQDASQFQVSIQARANINFPYKTAWNEVMIATWPPDIGNRLPIEAFWWNTAKASVAEAKAYQTKFKNKTGLWVPVIRVDVAQLNGRPFSYNAADQAVQP